ncbi:MAG: glutamine synthetase [Solirubrobacterales bacterium]|nr:glutamine synthetase [Solirubrobacterales bacterium]
MFDDDRPLTTVRVLFSDLHGVARGKDVPAAQFDRVAKSGLRFCAAVMGTDLRHNPVVGGEAGYPDMRAIPDLTTLAHLPWEPGVAACLADLRRPGTDDPEPTDPRAAVRRAVAELDALGFAAVVGPELEFYLCRAGETDGTRPTRFLDRLSMVYTVGPQADPDGIVRRLSEHLSRFGLDTVAANHEFCNSQYEINLREGPALAAADRAFWLKTAVKDVAALNGRVATFMGKPFNDQSGSGFHLHVSLQRDGRNAFDDPGDPDGVSPALRSFAAGVLRHAPALMALLNPTINAYRRLVPDSLAPTHANWGWDNRTTMVRVPPERGRGARLEVRVGDGSANPYLAVAAILSAGVHGLQEALALPAAFAGDVAAAGDAEPGLPLVRSLPAALDALEADDVLRARLAPELVDTFLALKRHEIVRHREWVSDWEVDEYLRHL